jgi:twitching motility protein PilU
MERVLRLMAEKNASDVYLSANTPILIKINGQILQLSDQVLTPTQPRQLLAELLTPQQLEELDDTGELNVGVGSPASAASACRPSSSAAHRGGVPLHPA